ncbi:MAG: GTPase Era [Gammaproteobacteria bacterium]|nr:GTPase Era [Gammaproteobacteria bacterium]MBT3859434.1 GTPase Era [Gammaproteobacteria bacterium]MBT3988196.1 GTPase Era [Gammaproteobacteria bacterium]MBT4256917.1 GTPase Era [Gammaproteobacteria bacterium]MBT4583339.1 GTPase Era [Gammaproteobacteria bacterium]
MSDVEDQQKTRCGLVAIVGRPNVGKSTLLNHLLRQKISITSRKPQTTRHRILGINSDEHTQCIFVDTPGLHGKHDKALNRAMNETVASAVKDVDLILFVVERFVWNDTDDLVLKLLENTTVPVILLINKIDLIKDKEKLLPHIGELSAKRDFAEIIPVSALGGHNLDVIETTVNSFLPVSPFLFPEDQITDRSSRFLAAELIREKVTRQLGEEIPYEITVEIEKYEQVGSVLHIHGLILVDKKGQKRIIIGKDGERLKQIGSSAREDMEKTFESKVMLNLWVKVKSGWADDERALQSLGYID